VAAVVAEGTLLQAVGLPHTRQPDRRLPHDHLLDDRRADDHQSHIPPHIPPPRFAAEVLFATPAFAFG
jgi:hypothetical protein